VITYTNDEIRELAESIDPDDLPFRQSYVLMSILCNSRFKYANFLKMLHKEKRVLRTVDKLMHTAPLWQMPLYINLDYAPALRTIAIWRLRIAK